MQEHTIGQKGAIYEYLSGVVAEIPFPLVFTGFLLAAIGLGMAARRRVKGATPVASPDAIAMIICGAAMVALEIILRAIAPPLFD